MSGLTTPTFLTVAVSFSFFCVCVCVCLQRQMRKPEGRKLHLINTLISAFSPSFTTFLFFFLSFPALPASRKQLLGVFVYSAGLIYRKVKGYQNQHCLHLTMGKKQQDLIDSPSFSMYRIQRWTTFTSMHLVDYMQSMYYICNNDQYTK